MLRVIRGIIPCSSASPSEPKRTGHCSSSLLVTSLGVDTMPDVDLRPGQEATVLEQKLDGAKPPVGKLTLTNCVVADPDDLLRCVMRCTELRMLYCLSSGIRLKHLVDYVLPALKNLSHLEFTLDKREDVEELSTTSHNIRTCDTLSESINYLYVEVAGSSRTELVTEMISRLPNVFELHVHILRGKLSDLVSIIEGAWRESAHILCLKITSEVPPEVQREPRDDVPSDGPRFGDYANVCGNLLLRRDPPTRNCFRLRDLAVRTDRLHPIEPVIVVVNIDETTPIHVQMGDAGTKNEWYDVHSLSLVLVGPDGPFLQEVARAGESFHSGLVSFLDQFRSKSTAISSLKELNVSSFHFREDLDFTEVLSEAGLTALTALSVTPCGISHPGALQRLAATCTQLEDLDIRIYTNYRKCFRCWQPLSLCPVAASQLSLNRGRLTFSNVMDIYSLHFLSVCQISELRMSGMCSDPRKRVKDVIAAVRQNESLRSLVLNFFGIVFDQDFTESLAMLLALRFLCLQTPMPHDIFTVRSFMETVTTSSPMLEVMHVHFTHNETGSTQRYTWVRKAESVEELRSAEAPPGPVQGDLFTDRPCVICSTQTYIGLVKPHNRGARTQV
ncbi:hypothetical protein HPB50_025462 [Hyalomma asiaticum]|uniref:Uncharacterized protein n=1 Tax=Hyalomma asiaticum TaxID=266040 RepID=A0ACB7S9M6_HYAAI|nr:hypothetical protein HPB50_025462 [Hyalomma asiaticum]